MLTVKHLSRMSICRLKLLALLPPAGAPLYSATFVCDSGQCFRLYTSTKNYDGARQQCALDGGDLVVYASLEQQMLAEHYFRWGEGGCSHAEHRWWGMLLQVGGGPAGSSALPNTAMCT